MTNTIYLLVFLLSLTLSSCGGAEHSATDTGSASFGLTFEEASAPVAMKLAPSAAPADICSSYGIATISADIGNASTEQPGLLYVAASAGPWPCSAHQGKITNVPPGSNYTLKLYAYAMNSNINIIWMGETTGVTINAGQDTNIGSISMTYMGNDTTPPTVSASTPTGTNVPVTSPITVTFSEYMASSTIDTTTFTLQNGSVAVSGNVSYNSTTKTATFTPTSTLSNSVIYTATVTTDVTDMAANKMLSLYIWDFTTEAPPGSAPTTPTGVSATAADKQVTVSWPAVTGATSYNIYWSTTTGVTKTNGTLITGATSPYIHTALTNGTTYYYVVTAVNSYGESEASSQVSAMPLPPITSAPTGVSVAAGNTQVTISWSAVSGATSYNLYWSTTTGVTTANGTKITGAASPYTHTGLITGTTYYYIVTAVNAGGESNGSGVVSATTKGTDVSGLVVADITWTLANSPYIATGNVLINSGVTLTIEPGVMVKFDGQYRLVVGGNLIAKGQSDQPIYFTSNKSTPKGGDWEGIIFNDSSVDASYDANGNYVDGSIIQYATIEYAGDHQYDSALGGSIRINTSSPYIDHNNIRNNVYTYHNEDGGGISIEYGGNPRITNNIIADNQSVTGGGINILSADGIIENNYIVNNSASKGGGIYIWGNSNAMITMNTIINNSANEGGGIYIRSIALSSTFKANRNNIHSNIATYQVYRKFMDGNIILDFTNNWWNTTISSEVEVHIYDYYDDLANGIIKYDPLVTTEIYSAVPQ